MLSEADLEQYRRDGVILVKGLLSGAELKAAQAESTRLLEAQKPTFPAYRLINFQGWRTSKAFRTVAMDSSAPGIAAQVMGLMDGEGRVTARGKAKRGGGKGEKQPQLRVLKDALLAFKAGDSGCGWHTDDKFFWPAEDVPAAAEDSGGGTATGADLQGCNVWIALTPVRAAEGGGLAVAPTSFKAPWREEARRAIAFEVGSPPTTCEMASLSPRNHRRLEGLKALHDMEPGDALVHARYCFHRGEPFREIGAAAAAAANGGEGGGGGGAATRVAYSVRYERGDAKIVDNKFERALRQGKVRGGDRLSDGGAFYPCVWPRPSLRERLAILAGRVKPDM